MSVTGTGTRTVKISESADTVSGPLYIDRIQWVGQTGVAAVVTLVVTHECIVAGNVTVTLPGLAAVDIAVADTDDTPTKVATAIRTETFTGWTTGGTGATVTFTCDATGIQPGTPTFTFAATEVLGTITYTTHGVGNQIAADDHLSITVDGGVRFAHMAVAGELGCDREFRPPLRVRFGETLTVATMANGAVYLHLQ